MSQILAKVCVILIIVGVNILVCANSLAQDEELKNERKTVGLVLSGGGAKGAAHIGVIKVLEEHGIPIDYITGTSIGAIVGGFYAAGYKIQELDSIFRKPIVYNWASGVIEPEDKYIYGAEYPSSAWLNARINFKKKVSATINYVLLNDASLNFAIYSRLYRASKKANYDFDNLPIPYRSVVADIFTQKSEVISKGELGDAIRASMAVPMVYDPVKIDDRYFYDGGVYDNLPVKPMIDDFNPDVIIAVNLGANDMMTDYPYDRDEEFVSKSIIKWLVVDYQYPKELQEKDVYLGVPTDDFSSSDFLSLDTLMKIGEKYARENIDEIIEKVGYTDQPPPKSIIHELYDEDTEEISKVKFNDELTFGQRVFLRNILTPKNENDKALSLKQIEKRYNRLISNEYLSHVKPKFLYDSLEGDYTLYIDMKPEKKMKVGLGGAISTRNVGQAFGVLEFQTLNRNLYSFKFNGYSGAFFNSALLDVEMIKPATTLFGIGFEGLTSKWNYTRTAELLFSEDTEVTGIRKDNYIGGKFILITGKRALLNLFAGYSNNVDEYARNLELTTVEAFGDTPTLGSVNILGVSRYRGGLYGARFRFDNLDVPQFATKGTRLNLSYKYVDVNERFQSVEANVLFPFTKRNWHWIRGEYEGYLKRRKWFGGLDLKYDWTDMPNSYTFTGSFVNLPTHYPIIDTRSLLSPINRAKRIFTAGVKTGVAFTSKFQMRVEFYTTFRDGEYINFENSELNFNYVDFDNIFSDVQFMGMGALVYNTSLGPLSFAVNYYDDPNVQWGGLLTFGYLLYNPRPIEW